MDGFDQVWIFEIEIVVTAVDKNAFGIKHGSHCTIRKDHSSFQSFKKSMHLFSFKPIDLARRVKKLSALFDRQDFDSTKVA
jgi:hypothetical protein